MQRVLNGFVEGLFYRTKNFLICRRSTDDIYRLIYSRYLNGTTKNAVLLLRSQEIFSTFMLAYDLNELPFRPTLASSNLEVPAANNQHLHAKTFWRILRFDKAELLSVGNFNRGTVTRTKLPTSI